MPAGLRGVSLQIHEGEFVALMGASGSGKSTLLHLLGALDTPDAGQIRFRGESLGNLANPARFRARHIGFVFQSFHLLPTLTAVENVQVPMFEMSWPLRERQNRARDLLAAVGMFVVGGAFAIWEGVQGLVHPPELDAFWAGVAVLVIALLLDGTSRLVAGRQLRVQAARRELSVREFVRETPDPTVLTVFLEDTIDVLGAALALVAIVLHRVTGSGVPDALGSIVIGCLLCYLASRLATRNRQLLTNQSVPDRYVQRLRARLEAEPAVRAVTRLDAVYLGPAEVLVAADVEMSDRLTGGEVAGVLSRLRADLGRDVPAIARFYLTPVAPPDLQAVEARGPQRP